MSRPKYWWYDYVKKSIMHSHAQRRRQGPGDFAGIHIGYGRRERVEAYRGTHAATESPEMV